MVINMDNADLTIDELIEKGLALLKGLNYCKQHIESNRAMWDKFKYYAKNRNETAFSKELASDFLRNAFGISGDEINDKKKVNTIRKMKALADVAENKLAFSRRAKREYHFPMQFEGLFSNHMEKQKSYGLSQHNTQAMTLYLERFAIFLDQNNVKSFNDINVEHLNKFTTSLAIHSPSTVANMLGQIKHLLKYAHENGYIEKDLTSLVPKVSYNKKSKIPSAFTKDEVEKILATVDRGNPCGKRDYAMLLLAARLGLRASDICNLTFEDISWENEAIHFVSQKTKTDILLPLLPDVGEAIIDYLKFSRPQSERRNIFLRQNAPFTPFNSYSTHGIMRKHIGKSNISVPKGKKHGFHSLRHSLASNLLDANTPIAVISEILSHQNSDSTEVYLKIHLNKLRECSLDAPSYESMVGSV